MVATNATLLLESFSFKHLLDFGDSFRGSGAVTNRSYRFWWAKQGRKMENQMPTF